MSLDIHDPDLADYDPYIWDTEYFRTKQQQDQFCEEKIRKLQAEASQELRNTFSIGENGLLYKAGQDGHQLVVPVRMRGEVLKMCHDIPAAGHYAQLHTLRKIQRNFWWPKMSKDVTQYVASCDICLRHNPGGKRTAPMVRMPIASAPMERAHLDLIGPLPRDLDGNVQPAHTYNRRQQPRGQRDSGGRRLAARIA